MCRINADVFPGSLNSNTDIVIADVVKLSQSELIFTVSDELSLESPIKWQLNVLLQSLASIPQIYQSIFLINQPERKTLLGTMPCTSRRKVPGCVPDVRIEVLRAAWSIHWRQCVWLTCPTPTRDTLASRCSKSTAQKLPRCCTYSSTCHCRPLLLTDTCFRWTLSRCTNYFAMLMSLYQRTPAWRGQRTGQF